MSGQVRIETTQNVDLHIQVAPLGERIVAYIVDAMIRGALLVVLFIFYSGTFGNLPGTPEVVIIFIVVITLIPLLTYNLLFEVFNRGQTPGKKLFDLRVASLKGDSVTFSQYLLRWLFRLVDFHIFSGLVALIAVAASDKGQRIGDMVAGTTVIKESRAIRFRQLAFDETPAAYVATYPQARELQPAHIELIKDTLGNLDLDHSEEHVTLLAEKTARLLNVQYQEHPRKFLRTVVQDYSQTSRIP